MSDIRHYQLSRWPLLPESSFDCIKRLAFGLDHVKEADNRRNGCASTEQKVRPRSTLGQQDWADEGNKEVANPIEACKTSATGTGHDVLLSSNIPWAKLMACARVCCGWISGAQTLMLIAQVVAWITQKR